MFGSLVDEDDLSAEFVYVKYGKCDKVAHWSSIALKKQC
jgi:hypothetical protein